ncbi:class B secretin-like G-protein coupled receptor GPRmth1, putative [Pediculus humanus corporis]|uniref:Class B secretin-like G-protein coupled receptor GPRmth1, putative n=1 Tax=Pediculus humanus subsp. corporis TaxID=121224 RepID=E0VM50_PEDHC|nr:class B secretin-like G-protein coupled receptor GPRmth1, putative [Pediculus humanus corporis]EEB14456.1 class B secretin-like G-protein coupled receptor GPRmth1, putative [Pediculus humanus corporis]
MKMFYTVCICTTTPCLRKCCLKGQVFINNTCKPRDLDIKPAVFTEGYAYIPDYGISNFHRAFGDTCKYKSYQLEPEVYPTDEYYLITNGTLVLPNDNVAYDASQFCFENIIRNSNDDLNSDYEEIILKAFVCFPEEPQPPEKMIAYPVGMIISMPFLLATFIVYSLPELRNLHGKNLMSEVASLLTAYIALVTTQLGGNTISDTLCIICGFLTQYGFLATFFWLNVMCFDIWSTFSGFGKFSGRVKVKELKKYILYSFYAWGCPTLILLVTVAIDYSPNVPDFIIKPNIGTKKCYFETKIATLVYFYAPMAVIVICDITLFVLTAFKICKVRKETKVLMQNENRRNEETNKQRYNLYLKLFLVMGINWVTEIISWLFEGPKEFWYFTDFMNSLQGVLIFVICVLTKSTKKRISKRFSRTASKSSKTNTLLLHS